MLQRLHELNPALVRRLSRRCFFVVNKKDVADSAEGMGEEETREYVAALVTEQMAVPGFELAPEQARRGRGSAAGRLPSLLRTCPPHSRARSHLCLPQIFLVSALNALRARQALRPGAAPAEVEAFRQLAFGKAWKRISDPETIRCLACLAPLPGAAHAEQRPPRTAPCRETALEVLADSGVPELEHGVLGFLATRALVLHRVALADDCERLLTQVRARAACARSLLAAPGRSRALPSRSPPQMHNLTSASAASLHRSVEALAAQISQLKASLEATLAQFEDVGREVQELEGLVVDEVGRTRVAGRRRPASHRSTGAPAGRRPNACRATCAPLGAGARAHGLPAPEAGGPDRRGAVAQPPAHRRPARPLARCLEQGQVHPALGPRGAERAG